MPERELLAEALGCAPDTRSKSPCPQRGEKREIVDAALQNAREQLGPRLAENASQRELLEGVAETFGLEAPPKRIEVYDNSHIQGANAVGAHDRRRARRLRERRISQIQHQIGRPHAGRRFRHDARSADAPLRAACARKRARQNAATNGTNGPIWC